MPTNNPLAGERWRHTASGLRGDFHRISDVTSDAIYTRTLEGDLGHWPRDTFLSRFEYAPDISNSEGFSSSTDALGNMSLNLPVQSPPDMQTMVENALGVSQETMQSWIRGFEANRNSPNRYFSCN